MADRSDLDLLTGPEAPDLVLAALTGRAGESGVEELQVEVDRVHHRPGAGVSVGYRVRYRSGGADVTEYLVASTAPRIPDSDAVAVLDDGVHRVRVWRHPDDPALPGLRGACDVTTVSRWLAGAGLVPAGAPVRLDLLAYRPTRRAVLRAASDDVVLFLKVVQPRRADALARRHAVLEEAGLGAPRVAARPAPGVVALTRVPGRPLAEAVAGALRDPAGLPTPDLLEAWLDALPAEVTGLSRRPSWADRVDFHAAAARAAVPDLTRRVDDLERGIRAMLGDGGPDVPTHGDFYEANVFTESGRVTGVIDVDSLGPGRRADDVATLLGHLAVLPALAPAVYEHVPGLTGDWLEHFSRHLEPVDLRARTAAVVLSLVAGTSGEQAGARLDVAEDWLRDARQGAASVRGR